MRKWLLGTTNDKTTVALRVVLGLVMFPHGAQKLLGWFGGGGPGATLQALEQFYGVPPLLGALVIGIEFFGSLALIAGAFTRLAALGVGSVMAGALIFHLPNGFFMNWLGTQRGEGFEFHLLAIALSMAVLVRGAGAWSVDRAVTGPQTA
jgi:putative oxidoreductase